MSRILPYSQQDCVRDLKNGLDRNSIIAVAGALNGWTFEQASGAIEKLEQIIAEEAAIVTASPVAAPAATVEPQSTEELDAVDILGDIDRNDILTMQSEAIGFLDAGKSIDETAIELVNSWEGVSKEQMTMIALQAEELRKKMASQVQTVVEIEPVALAAPASTEPIAVLESERSAGEAEKKTETAAQEPALIQPDANGEFPTPVEGAIWMLVTHGIPQTVLCGVDWTNVEEKRRGKAPFLSAWQRPENTLKTVEAIRTAATKYRGCNFGSVFNKDIFAFEADTPPAGVPTARERFEKTGATFTSSLVIESSEARGHRYYKWVAGVENIAQSIEATKYGDYSIRVDGEQCVSPGSVHPRTRKQYRVISSGVVNAPSTREIAFWNSERVTNKTLSNTPTGERRLLKHGQMHGAYVAEAGRLWNRGHRAEDVVEMTVRWTVDNSEDSVDENKVRKEALNVTQIYKRGQAPEAASLVLAQAASDESAVPIVDDPSENDSRFEMAGETFDTKVYEDAAKRFIPYPDPGEDDLISKLAKKLVAGTPIPLAYVREPLKAMVLHAVDGKIIHPAHRKLTLRGNYFSLGESESSKTTGLQYALDAGNIVLATSGIHPQDLFRYKSEQTFIRSFTPEGTIKRDAHGTVKSGRSGHSSQFLYIKEGNLVANCSEYFGAVFSRLTDLYDQTQAATESMTNGDFEAGTVKASTIMCFTPTDYAKTFSGKGTIGGGGLNRWGLVSPPEDHSYDDRDWAPLSETEIQEAINALSHKVFELTQGNPVVLTEDEGAAKVRLETKAILKKAGKAGKRLLEYFMREQIAQAVTATDGRLVMTTKQARYAQQWAEAQVECRVHCWPSDSNNQIEAMEHAIRKAVYTHFVSDTRLRDVCNFYREGSGGWFVFNAARSNAISSGAIKWTGRTRKGARSYCPGSCAVHPPVTEDK